MPSTPRDPGLQSPAKGQGAPGRYSDRLLARRLLSVQEDIETPQGEKKKSSAESALARLNKVLQKV